MGHDIQLQTGVVVTFVISLFLFHENDMKYGYWL